MEKLVFYAFGHPNIQATHRNTLEITKENYLSLRGDCIIAIRSQYACKDLPKEMIQLMKNEESRIILTIEVDELKERIEGYGDKRLMLTSSESMVIRKSTYIDKRTLMVKADKSAADLDRKLVDKLKNPGEKARITLEVIKKNMH